MSTLVASRLRKFSVWIALAFLLGATVVGALYYSLYSDIPTHRTSSAQREAEVGRVGGEVFDTEHLRLSAATLCAYGVDRATRLERACTSLSSAGNYVLDLKPGQYAITASAEGHESATTETKIGARDVQRLNFTLEKKLPTLAGTIKSASGVSIAGAHVAIYHELRVVSNVQTNAAGEFRAWTPSGSLVVNAEADGFGAASIHTVAPASDVNITLFPGNSVSGQVLIEGSLRPVPDVRVTAASRADRILNALRDSAVRTDSEGRFHFKNLSAGAWFLMVADRNLWGTLASPIQVKLGEATDNVVLVVRQAGRVSGRFTVGGDGHACPSGLLQLVPASTPNRASNDVAKSTANDSANAAPLFTAEVGADGAIEFDAVPYDSYRVGPWCNDHRFATGPATLEVTREQTAGLIWNFNRGAEIAVTVVDELRKPIPKMLVTLAPTNAEAFTKAERLLAQRSGVTDAKGEYRFGGLLEGRYRVSARYAALNNNQAVSDEIDATAASSNSTTLFLPSGGVIRIHAHDATHAPVSRMLFFATNESGARYEANFSGDGIFSIGPMPQESYRVYAYDNKNAKIILNRGSPVLVRGGDAIDLDFNYQAPTAYIEGQIVDGTGAPLSETLVRAVSTTLDENDARFAGIQVSMQGAQELMTDRDGRFRIDGLDSRATYDLYIDHRSGLQDIRRNVVPGSFIEIALPSTATLVGRAIDANNKALSRFDVLIEAENQTHRSESFTDANGRFRIEHVFPGRLHIAVIDPSGNASLDAETSVLPGQVLDLGSVALVKAAPTEQ